MNAANPLELLKKFPVEETKLLVKSLRSDIQEIKKDPDYDGEADVILSVIGSLEKELGKAKEISELSIDKQARVLADMCLLMQFLQAESEEGEEDWDDDEEYDEEFEDEDEEEDGEEDLHENEDEDEDHEHQLHEENNDIADEEKGRKH